MIKNIIFDFGDIFIDLDKEAPIRNLLSHHPEFVLKEDTIEANLLYEKGLISTEEFIDHYKRVLDTEDIEHLKWLWNSIILTIPEHRLSFLEKLRNLHEYKIFLLSNTNALHIEKVIENIGMDTFLRFKNQFDEFYLSHEIKLRKPDPEIYNFVLENNGLNPSETLFVDDVTENTEAAKSCGIHTWNLRPGIDDVSQLMEQNLPF